MSSGFSGGIDLSKMFESLKNAIKKNLQESKSEIDNFNKVVVKSSNIITEEVKKASQSFQELPKGIKKMATYYTDITTAQKNVIKSLKELNEAQNNNDSNAIKDASLNVIKYSNVFQALGGNLRNVSKEAQNTYNLIKKFPKSFGFNIDNIFDNKSFKYTIENFEKVFSLIEKIQATGNAFSSNLNSKRIISESQNDVTKDYTYTQQIREGRTQVVKVKYDAEKNTYLPPAIQTYTNEKEIENRIKTLDNAISKKILEIYKNLNKYPDYDSSSAQKQIEYMKQESELLYSTLQYYDQEADSVYRIDQFEQSRAKYLKEIAANESTVKSLVEAQNEKKDTENQYKEEAKVLKEAIKGLNEYYTLSQKNQNNLTAEEQQKWKQLTDIIDEADRILLQYIDDQNKIDPSKIKNNSQSNALTEQLSNYGNKSNIITSSISSLTTKGNNLLSSIDSSKYIESYQNNITSLKNKILELNNLNLNLNDKNFDTEIVKIAQLENEISELMGDLASFKNKNEVMAVGQERINQVLANTEATLNKNSRMSKELRTEYENQIRVLKELAINYKNVDKVSFNNILSNVEKLNVKLQASKKTGLSLLDMVKTRLVRNTAQTIATYFGLYDFIRYGKEAITTIEELDTALIDLKKTTTMTTSQLEDFYMSASETASQVGVTTEEIISQAAAWSRLGYSSSEAATQMAKLSSQFAAISPDMDTDTATDGLVSIMQAYGYEVDDVLDGVMSKINQIGNTMATTNGEIVTMLEKSSSSMKEANNTLEETIALESAAVEITRDADSVGTAYKTISMRIRGYDEETEEYSDDVAKLTGKIADYTKTAKTPGGISLYTDETKTEYKSTYELLKEISEIYDDLSDKDQAELLEALAGKRNGQIVAATISNFASAEEALQTMENSAGSANREMSTIEDSIEFKINALKQTWVGTLQSLVDKGEIGNIVDALNDLSKVISTIVEKIGLLPAILGTISTYMSAKGYFPKFTNLLNNIINSDGVSEKKLVTNKASTTSNKTNDTNVKNSISSLNKSNSTQSNDTLLSMTKAARQVSNELSLSNQEAREFIKTSGKFSKVGDTWQISSNQLDELVQKQKELNASSSVNKETDTTTDIADTKNAETQATDTETVAEQKNSTAKEENVAVTETQNAVDQEHIANEETKSAIVAANNELVLRKAAVANNATMSEQAQISAEMQELGITEDLNLLTMERVDALIAENEGMSINTQSTLRYIAALNEEKTVVQELTLLEKAGKVAATAFNTAISFGLGLLIGKVIEVASTAIDNLIHKSEKITESAETAQQAISDIKSEFDTTKESANDIKKEFAELAQGVEDLGKASQNRGTLSTEDYEKFLEDSNKLAELFPSLTTAYDENGNAILNLSGSVDTIVGSIDSLIDAEERLANKEIMDNMSDTWKGYSQDITEANQNLDENQSKLNKMQDILNKANSGQQFTLGSEASDSFLNAMQSAFGKDYEDWYQENSKKMFVKLDYTDPNNEVSTIDLSKLSEEDQKKIKDALGQEVADIQSEVDYYNDEVKSIANQFNQNLQSYFATDVNFQGLSSTAQANILQAIENDTNLAQEVADYYGEDVEDVDWTEVKKYLQSQVVGVFSSITDPIVIEEINNAFAGELSSDLINQLIDQLVGEQGFSEDNPIIVYLKAQATAQKQEENHRNSVIAGIMNATSSTSAPGQPTTAKSDAQKKYDAEREEFLSGLDEEQLDLIQVHIDEASEIKTEQEFEDWANGLKAEATVEVTNADTVTELDDIKSAMDTIQEAYSNFADSSTETVDVDNLKAIGDIFDVDDWEDGIDYYNEFLDVMTDTTSTADEQQEAFDKLATAYVDHTDLIQDLTAANAEYTASELTKMGVANSEAVVWDRVADNEENADEILAKVGNGISNTKKKLKGYDGTIEDAMNDTEFLEHATYSEIAAFAAESNASDEVKRALYEVAMRKLLLNGTTIDFSGDVDSINSYIEFLTGKASQALTLWSAIKSGDTDKNGGYYIPTSEYTKIQDSGQADVDTVLNNNTTVKYTPPSDDDDSGSNSSDSSDSKSYEVYDWIEKRLDKLSKIADKLSAKADRFADRVSNLNESISNILQKYRSSNISVAKQVKDTAKAIYNAGTESLNAYDAAIGKQENVYKANTKASSRYMKQADKQAKLAVAESDDSSTRKITKAEQKTINSFKKKYKNGQIGGKDIQRISNETVKTYMTEWATWYDKSKEASDAADTARETINSLMDSYSEMAETMAQAPIQVATEKINDLSDALDILDAKASNFTVDLTVSNGASTSKGKLTSSTISQEENYAKNTIANNNQQNQAYQEAYTLTQSNLKSSKTTLAQEKKSATTSLNKFIKKGKKNKSGLTVKQLNKIKSIISKGTEEIPQEYLSRITNNDLYDACVEYNEAFLANEANISANETARQNALKSAQEVKQKNRQAIVTEAENIQQAYERQISSVQQSEDAVSSYQSMLQNRGYGLSDVAYKAEIKSEKTKLQYYTNLKADQEKRLKEIEALGGKGTDEWWTLKEAIDDTSDSIIECESNINDYQKSINDLADSVGELIKSNIGMVTNTITTLSSLMDYAEDFDSTTHLVTDEGIARLGLYENQLQAQQVLSANSKANYDAVEAAKNSKGTYNSTLGQNEYTYIINGQEVTKTWDELLKDEQTYGQEILDNAQSEYSIKKEIWEWEKEKLQAELALAQEDVDNRKEALNTAKDLHDYQKSIQEKTDNITSLNQQIAALSGNNSQDASARMQSLQKQLLDAQDDLQETEYDRYISDTSDMLDDMMTEYTDLINEESTKFYSLLEQGLSDVTGKEDTISAQIGKIAEEYGINNDTSNSLSNKETVDNTGTTEAQKEKQSAQETSALEKFFEAYQDYDKAKTSDNYKALTTAYNNLSDDDKNRTDVIKDMNNAKGSQSTTTASASTSTATSGSTSSTTSATSKINGAVSSNPPTTTPKDQINSNLAKMNNKYKTNANGTSLKKKLSAMKSDLPLTSDNASKHKSDLKFLKRALYALGYTDINPTSDNFGSYLKSALKALFSHEKFTKADDNNLIKRFTSAGFSQGGIVKAVHKNGDDGLATLKHGEAVFTPVQTKTFTQDFMPAMENMISSANILDNLINNGVGSTTNTSGDTNVTANYSFNLDNVTNAKDIIECIQKDNSLQNLLYDATVGKSMNGNKNRTKLNKY